MGRVRTKTVKRAVRIIVVRYYGKLTMDFQVHFLLFNKFRFTDFFKTFHKSENIINLIYTREILTI